MCVCAKVKVRETCGTRNVSLPSFFLMCFTHRKDDDCRGHGILASFSLSPHVCTMHTHTHTQPRFRLTGTCTPGAREERGERSERGRQREQQESFSFSLSLAHCVFSTCSESETKSGIRERIDQAARGTRMQSKQKQGAQQSEFSCRPEQRPIAELEQSRAESGKMNAEVRVERESSHSR